MAAVVAVVVALVASAFVPAVAGHVPQTPDYHVVDGEPICGTEGSGRPARLARGDLPAVGTFNVLHSQGEDDDADVSDRLDQVVDAMLDDTGAPRADAWGLQEVTNNEEHGNVAQRVAAGLAERTGEPWEWCWSWSNPHFPAEPDLLPGGGGPLSQLVAQFSNLPEGDLRDFKEGVAVVTRFHVTEARFRRLPPRAHEALACPPSPDPLDLIGCQFPAVFDHRQVLWTRINTRGGGQFDLFDTHLAHGLTDHSDEVKLAQTRKALATIEEWHHPKTPDVFVGDFNSDPSTDRYDEVVGAGFTDTYRASGEVECGSDTGAPWRGCTSSQRVLTDDPTPTVRTRIDHVFVRTNGCDLAIAGSTIVGTNAEPLPDGRWRWPSDHLGVASQLACAGP